jgi:hypothetical protein
MGGYWKRSGLRLLEMLPVEAGKIIWKRSGHVPNWITELEQALNS